MCRLVKFPRARPPPTVMTNDVSNGPMTIESVYVNILKCFHTNVLKTDLCQIGVLKVK